MKTIIPQKIYTTFLEVISLKSFLLLILYGINITGIIANHDALINSASFYNLTEGTITNPGPVEPGLSISVEGAIGLVPANNNCIDAIPIQCGEVVSGTTIGASIDATLNNCVTGFNGAPGVWYSITGISGTASATTCSETGPLFDTKLGVYAGSCDNLKCITGNDDAPNGSVDLDCSIGFSFFNRASYVEFQAVADETYYIYVSGFLNSSNNFELTLSCTSTFDCPALLANIGDNCNDENDLTENDVVTENCECVGTEIIIPLDCPELEANIGDTCDDGNENTENDLVTENCECVGTEIIIPLDCPELDTNIGDMCDDGNENTENDVVTENCECVGTEIIIPLDCPELEANIGDMCDDGNENTENDVVTENCECAGTEIIIPLDCPELEANIGDTCDDGNENTVNDVITANCVCAGAPANIDECQDFVYYLSDHDPNTGISDIYEVILSSDVATMNFIATSAIEVHIAYHAGQDLIYAISKNNNSFRTLDPATAVWGPTISLTKNVGRITAAVFNHDGKLLIGSQNQKVIYSVNITTYAVSLYDKYVPLTGGDLAFASDGMLYMATRSSNGLYEVWPAPMNDNLIAILPAKVTGMAITNADQLLISSQGNSSLILRNTDGTNPMVSFNLMLNGEPYILRDGDMASGCAGSNSPQPPINPLTVSPSQSSLSSYPNPTKGNSKVVFTTSTTTRTLLEVYDMNGRNVATLFDHEALQGKEYTLDFNGQNLSNGVYLYRLTTSNETIIEKFMIAR